MALTESGSTVLLHPLPLSGSMWQAVADRLEGEVHVVPSLYALGDSLTAWAKAVLDVVGEGPHTVVGNSVGASCAAEMAFLAPDRVDRVVMLGGKLGHRPEPKLRDEAVCVIAPAPAAARAAPHHGFHLIPGVGHYLPIEAPNAVASIVNKGPVGSAPKALATARTSARSARNSL